MRPHIWEALRPYLHDVSSIDFTGGGEPLLQKHLFHWIEEAKNCGCDVGFLTNGLLLSEKLSDKTLHTGINWIGFSIDGADKETYQSIRKGADFTVVCDNIRYLTGRRARNFPLTMINFVIMRSNYHQLKEIIQLAHDLGVDQVNFKQCDVIRGDRGKGHGLFAAEESKPVRQLKNKLRQANRLARKLGVQTTAFSFSPAEQPVCVQDPRDSLFIRYDGSLSPCINLAMGGDSSFLGRDIKIPTVVYGNLPGENLHELWENDKCRYYRRRFSERVKAFETSLSTADLGHDIIQFKRALRKAEEAMGEAPEGCTECHYLYDI